jgi:hypothetical protein
MDVKALLQLERRTDRVCRDRRWGEPLHCLRKHFIINDVPGMPVRCCWMQEPATPYCSLWLMSSYVICVFGN